ncbi:hypothetical protein EDC01DRAFT_637631 [Geopyxis carbonaria]|nr:hypothetical protein EDC01DRAFT_637631 [Geopyxis carbonaria]
MASSPSLSTSASDLSPEGRIHRSSTPTPPKVHSSDAPLLSRLNALLTSVSLPPVRSLLEPTPNLLILLYELLPLPNAHGRLLKKRERIPFVVRSPAPGDLSTRLRNLKLLLGTMSHNEEIGAALRERLIDLDLAGFCEHRVPAVRELLDVFLRIVERDDYDGVGVQALPDLSRSFGEVTPRRNTRFVRPQGFQQATPGKRSAGFGRELSYDAAESSSDVSSTLLDEVSSRVKSVLSGVSHARDEPNRNAEFESDYSGTPRTKRIERGIIRSPRKSATSTPRTRFNQEILVGESFLGPTDEIADLCDSSDDTWKFDALDIPPSPPQSPEYKKLVLSNRPLPRGSVRPIATSTPKLASHPGEKFRYSPPKETETTDSEGINPEQSEDDSDSDSDSDSSEPFVHDLRPAPATPTWRNLPQFRASPPQPLPPLLPQPKQDINKPAESVVESVAEVDSDADDDADDRTSQLSVSPTSWSSDSSYTAAVRQKRHEALQRLRALEARFDAEIRQREEQLKQKLAELPPAARIQHTVSKPPAAVQCTVNVDIVSDASSEERKTDEGDADGGTATVQLDDLERMVRELLIQKGYRIVENAPTAA